MYKFLFTSVFLLISNILLSQVGKEENTVIPTDTISEIKTDSINVSKFYKITLNRDIKADKPSPSELKPIKMIEPKTFVLFNGLKVILVENKKLPFTSFKLFFDHSEILLGKKKGVDLIFEKLWGLNGKVYKKKDVLSYKDVSGTNIIVNKNSIYIEGLSRHQSRNIAMLSDLAMQFRFSDDEFEETKDEIIDSLYFASNRNEFVVDAVARKLMFGSNHPLGESFNINDIDSITSKDVSNYYNSFFKPNNAYLMVYGNISMSQLKRMVSLYFNRYRKGEVLKGYYPQPYNIPVVEIDFIENYNSDSLCVWMGNVMMEKEYEYNWLFEKVNKTLLFDEDIGLFSNKFLNKNKVREFTDTFDGKEKYFALQFDVSEDDVASAIINSVEQLRKTSTDKMIDSSGFVEFKKKIELKYIEGLSKPSKITDLYLMYYVTGFGKYLVPNLMSVIDTISLPSISTSIRHQVKSNQLRIVVSGKPQIAVPKLEKLGYKINYYDQFAKKTFPPSLDRAVPDSIDVNMIMKKYISARGGEGKLKDVRKLWQWWVVDINNMKLFVKNKYMLPNKRLSTYSNGEVIVLKTVFNGEYGYVEKSGMINEITGDDFLELSMDKSIFPITHYMDLGYALSLESQIPLKGELCYKVRAEAPYGQVSLLYFRVDDGFLIKKEIIDIETNKVVSYFNYSDFKTFNDIIFPYKVETKVDGKKMVLILTQIKINNENVRRRDFK